MFQLKDNQAKREFFSVFSSIQASTGWMRATHTGRAIACTQSTDSNDNLIQIDPHGQTYIQVTIMMPFEFGRLIAYISIPLPWHTHCSVILFPQLDSMFRPRTWHRVSAQ